MVEIQVGEHDMAHVLGGETEPVQLFQRGVARLQADVVERPEERTEPLAGPPHVFGAETEVSTSTSPCWSVSSSRQWQTSCAVRPLLKPSNKAPPSGHMQPQFR